MRIRAFFFFLLFIAGVSYANDIDQLKTIADVQKFLVANVNKDWDEQSIIEAGSNDTQVFGKGKFFKIDLNTDGLTDLLIDDKYLLAILDSGNGRYAILSVDRGAFTLDKYVLVNILYNDRLPLLVVRSYNEKHFYIKDSTVTDTLVYKFGDFIEYNPIPVKLKIERIKFYALGCFGSCPIFELSIDSNRKSSYHAKSNNRKQGKFHAVIAEAEYNELIETINYIRLPTLKNNYRVGWTDDNTVILEITYNNGITKKIRDYGTIGTFGLENLYTHIYALRHTQKWR